MRLSGSITALATPFDAAGEIDLDAWRRLLQSQLEGGTQALVVAGSTGEAAALHDVEYDAILRTAVEAVAGRVPVLAGTGLSNTAKTIEQTRRAAARTSAVGMAPSRTTDHPSLGRWVANRTRCDWRWCGTPTSPRCTHACRR